MAKGVSSIDTLGGQQRMQIVNEAGLYSLVLKGKYEKIKKTKM